MWESVKNCSSVCKEAGTRRWISRVARGCKPPNWCTHAKHARSWSVVLAIHYRTKFPAGQAVCSRLELATQPSHEVKPPKHPVWQNMTFHISSHPTIYIYPYTHDSERASKKNFERETLEKKRLTHPQSLPKRLFKFLYSLPLHCQILQRLITKTFSHHIHSCERAVWCFGKQLGRNKFYIGWCYGQVAKSRKLEKK